ncbi:MAG: sigma-70 family RNA polymerase sigma factor [Actinomycetota bacterium]
MEDLTGELLRAGRGDRVAFASAVRRSQAEVWRLCAHLVGRQDADDVTQDTYARVVRALPAFRGDSSGRTWLLSIARRACADVLRRRTRERRRDRAIGQPEPAADPNAAVAVEALLVALAADQRVAFVLTQLHGLSYAEAAEIAGVPVGTIRS